MNLQALCTIPRNRQCEKASQMLGAFSAAVSRKTLLFSSGVSLSLSSGIGCGKLNGHRSFVLRAEAKSDEAEEAEEKPRGMPRIKFGDVIGVIVFNYDLHGYIFLVTSFQVFY